MITQTRTSTWLRVGFLVLGCALGVGYVVTGRVPQPERQLPAVVNVSWARSGDLIAKPAGQRLGTSKLKPGSGRLNATMSLRNPTDVALAARPRALGRPGALDDLLVVRVRVGREPVFEGPLRLLRALRATPITVTPRARARVRISVWLPGPAPARQWQDRHAAVRLEWRTQPIKAGG